MESNQSALVNKYLLLEKDESKGRQPKDVTAPLNLSKIYLQW